ncbi:hypothetical protein QTP70_019204, partial [Hemibagrus guttatus]
MLCIKQREPEPISGAIGHQGRIHPGWSTNPLQDIHTHSHSLTQFHTMGNLETPISLRSMSLDCGRKPEHPGGNPPSTVRTCKLHTH